MQLRVGGVDADDDDDAMLAREGGEGSQPVGLRVRVRESRVIRD